jgi:hypothetical protein
VQTLNRVVDAEIDALPLDMRARLVRLSTLIEQVGFEALPANSVKHLDEKLWELRISGRDGIWPTHDHSAGARKEDPEDAAART